MVNLQYSSLYQTTRADSTQLFGRTEYDAGSTQIIQNIEH